MWQDTQHCKGSVEEACKVANTDVNNAGFQKNLIFQKINVLNNVVTPQGYTR